MEGEMMYCLVTPDFAALTDKAWETTPITSYYEVEKLLRVSPGTLRRIRHRKVKRIRDDRMNTMRSWIMRTLGLNESELPDIVYYTGKNNGRRSAKRPSTLRPPVTKTPVAKDTRKISIIYGDIVIDLY